jgi:zinc protease
MQPRFASPHLPTLVAPLVLALSGGASAAEIPGLSSRTLENGLQVVVIENHNVPLATIELAVKSGAYVEPPELSGLSHLYEHMFFKGNRTLPDQKRYLERLQELGAAWNGTTGTERVNYFITLPGENLRDGVAFMRDALLYPLFKQDELERERIVVLGEMDRSEASPPWHLYRQVDLRLWYEHFTRKTPIGERAAIASATRGQMQLLKERYYVPNNMALLVAGDVAPGEVFTLAEEMFGPAVWPRSEEDPHRKWPVPEHPPLQQDSLLAVVQPVRTVTLQMSWHGPRMLEDTPATFAADVLSFILEQPTSRFHKKLIDSGLFDSVQLSYHSQVHTGPISVYGVTSAERLDRAHAALLEELGQLLDPEYYSGDEIRLAKDQLEYSEIYSREKTSDFVHTVSFWWATGGLDYYRNYLDNLRKVTRADIDRYVRRYIEGQHRVTGLLLGEEDLGKSELAAQAEVIRPRTGSSATALASHESAQPTELFEVEGVRVLLRQNPFSEVVTVKAFLEGGLAYALPESLGLELLLLEIAQKQSKHYPKEKMATELVRLGARLSSEALPDYTAFTLLTLKRHLTESLALFLDALVNPLVNEDELALTRERRLTALATEEQDPDRHLERISQEAVYGEHPFGRNPLGTRESIAEAAVEDLQKLHAGTFVRSRLLIVVVGDVTKEDLTALLAPKLAELPEGVYEPPAARAIPGAAESTLRTEARELPTTYVAGHFPAPNLEDPDYAALYVGMSLLYDRLWEEIRSKRSLSYAPGAGLRRRSANLGRLYVSTVDPNAAVQIMREEILKLQRDPVPESKLRNVVGERRTRLLSAMQTSSEIASWLGEFELHGGGWQRLDVFLESLGSLTPEQVRDAMAKHARHVDFAVLGKLEGLDEALFTSF